MAIAATGCRSAVTSKSPAVAPATVQPLSKALALSASNSWEHNVSLSWVLDADPYVAGYTVYWGTQSGQYSQSMDVPGRSVTNTTVMPLFSGITYFFALTCWTSNKVVSMLSNEVSYTPPPNPPILNAPFVSLTVSGPFTFWESTNLVSWDVVGETALNSLTLPIDNGNHYFRASVPSGELKLRIARSPQ